MCHVTASIWIDFLVTMAAAREQQACVRFCAGYRALLTLTLLTYIFDTMPLPLNSFIHTDTSGNTSISSKPLNLGKQIVLSILCASIEESMYVDYIMIISNPKVIRVGFQTSNTATDCVKNVGQLAAAGWISRSLRFQPL